MCQFSVGCTHWNQMSVYHAITIKTEGSSTIPLTLVSSMFTASASIPFHTPRRSSTRAMFGASWIPAPTKPKSEADS